MQSPNLKFTFKNSTRRPQFINLEISTSRYRVEPGEELFLIQNAAQHQDHAGSNLVVELFDNGKTQEMIVWTNSDELFHPDGRVASQNFDFAQDWRHLLGRFRRWLRNWMGTRRP